MINFFLLHVFHHLGLWLRLILRLRLWLRLRLRLFFYLDELLLFRNDFGPIEGEEGVNVLVFDLFLSGLDGIFNNFRLDLFRGFLLDDGLTLSHSNL